MHEFVISTIEQSGYIGLFLMMFLENIFPPIPSEVILPLTGFLIANGVLHPALALAVSVAGSTLGALPWFYLGVYVSGARRTRFFEMYGVFLSVSAEDAERAAAVFARHQWAAVFFGRLMPIIRTLISVPAGSVRMPLVFFLLLTALGSALWNSILFSIGFILKAEYHIVQYYLDPVTTGIIALIFGIYFTRIALHIMRRRRSR